jgi:hypothetical protein
MNNREAPTQWKGKNQNPHGAHVAKDYVQYNTSKHESVTTCSTIFSFAIYIAVLVQNFLWTINFRKKLFFSLG